MIASVFRNKRGQTLVFFALLLPVLMGFIGLVVDVGTLYVEKARLQSSVDAAAAAGALDLKTLSDHGTSEATARDLLQKNGMSPTNAAAAAVTYPAKPGDPAALLIRISATEAVPTYFMRVLGFISDIPVSASATAQAISGNGSFTFGLFAAKNLTLNGSNNQIGGDVYGGTSLSNNGSGITIAGTAETTNPLGSKKPLTPPAIVLSSPLPMPTINLSGKTTTFSGSNLSGDFTGQGVVILTNPNITISGTLKGTFYSAAGTITIKNKSIITGLIYALTGDITSHGSQTSITGGLVAGGNITLNGGMDFVQQPPSIITQPAPPKSMLIE